jgi:hypothetical protein
MLMLVNMKIEINLVIFCSRGKSMGRGVQMSISNKLNLFEYIVRKFEHLVQIFENFLRCLVL